MFKEVGDHLEFVDGFFVDAGSGEVRSHFERLLFEEQLPLATTSRRRPKQNHTTDELTGIYKQHNVSASGITPSQHRLNATSTQHGTREEPARDRETRFSADAQRIADTHIRAQPTWPPFTADLSTCTSMPEVWCAFKDCDWCAQADDGNNEDVSPIDVCMQTGLCTKH